MMQFLARGASRILCGLVLAFLIVACGQIKSTPAPTFAPTPTVAPLSTPTPPASASPTPTLASISTSPNPTVAICADTQGQVLAAQFASRILNRPAHYMLYLPPCYSQNPTRRYPALYLLHGANADDTQWLDLNVASDADQLISQHTLAPFVIVIADGDPVMGDTYGTFIFNELIPHIEQTIRVEPQRAARAIGGISRGGYWALQLALAHPDFFSAVGGHSPATYDSMLSTAATGWQNLRIYLDVGSDDTLAPSVRSFVAAMQAHGVSPEFHLNAGNHNRAYWRSHTKEYLEFYATKW